MTTAQSAQERPGGGPLSTALVGTERVSLPHPAWAGAEIPPGSRRLPLISADAVRRPGVGHTRERLEALGRERASGVWTLEAAARRERGAEIRRETLRDMTVYLDRLCASLEANGVVVHRVSTPEQAREAVGQVARDHGVSLVAKSKSMATEEIHLTAYLNELGIDVVETDLGEYIVQAAGQRPSHIVGPALHLSRDDVTHLFADLNGAPVSDQPDDLAAFARARLRADFKAAQMGVCGVNFAAADTGTLVIVTNEGNADMVTSQPDVVVAVMPIEKVIPRLSDVGVLVPLLSDTANKQFVTTYQTWLTGPRDPQAGGDGPRELHVVIFDNGRSDVLGTPLEEVLCCIRCGNCQFACPVFRTMGGGHGYASIYGGPIGAVLSPIIGDHSADADLPFMSSLCGACADACPVKIPLPDLLVELRNRYAEEHPDKVEDAGWRAWSLAWSTRAGYAASMIGAKVASVVPAGVLRRLPLASAWASVRSLPSLKGAGAVRRAARKQDHHDR